MSIFANDFVDAATRADESNQQALFGYCYLLYNAPSGCWGSKKRVEQWIAVGGLRGVYRKEELKHEADEPVAD